MFSLLLLTRQFQYCNNWHCSNLMFCLGAFQAAGVLVEGLWAGFAEALSQQACKSRALDFVVGHESSSERSCVYCTYTKMTLFVKCHHLLTYLCPSCQHGYRKIKDVVCGDQLENTRPLGSAQCCSWYCVSCRTGAFFVGTFFLVKIQHRIVSNKFCIKPSCPASFQLRCCYRTMGWVCLSLLVCSWCCC